MLESWDKISLIYCNLSESEKIMKTRDYFNATASNWNTSAQSPPGESLCIKTMHIQKLSGYSYIRCVVQSSLRHHNFLALLTNIDQIFWTLQKQQWNLLTHELIKRQVHSDGDFTLRVFHRVYFQCFTSWTHDNAGLHSPSVLLFTFLLL